MRSPSQPPLPIDEILPTVIERLGSAAGLVLRAPPGAGKTTRLPPALLAAGLAGERTIVMLEPRRLAARAATARIAREQGWRLGGEIGYQIRFERRASRATRLLVVTEGILVQMLQSDPFLESIGVVIFDEFHERNLPSDLALAMVRRVQQEARPDLKVVVMSATLEPQPIADFLGQVPTIESAGRSFPVALHYLDRPDPRSLPARTASGVERMLDQCEGDILAFLPGVGEIRRTRAHLDSLATRHRLKLCELYGDLPADRQDAALQRGAQRRVVLATNVAETSVTVDGIGAVVDSGLARVLRFDPATGLDRLELTRISLASADQRAGRAGRQRPGACLRLWTEHDQRSLQATELPEIRRVDLAAPCLQLLSWGETDLSRFGWFEAPQPEALDRALELLHDLGALADGSLTRLGRQLARLPLHPRLARLLVAGHQLGIPRRAAWAAAVLAEREIVDRPARDAVADRVSDCDVLDRLEALESFVDHGWGETALGPVRSDRARHVLRVGRQLERLAQRTLGECRSPSEASDEALRRALLTAYPDRLARRRAANGERAVMVGGRGVRLARTSTVRRPELFLCLDLRGGMGGEALVWKASATDRDFLDQELSTEIMACFDGERQRVVGKRLTRYRDLILEEAECDPGQEVCERLLIEEARRDLERALPLDDPAVASLLTRLRCLAEWRPDLGLPTFGADELAEMLPWLCAGKRSFADLRRAPLHALLRGRLSHEQLQVLERHAPERLQVPSGSRIRLDYELGKAPVLAVRIQELFGCLDTPTVAGGRVPVLLHLLAPNQRPQQITQDLRSFWTHTYPEVRKELQGRYPRHAWPEDPLSAAPERRPARRRPS